MIDLDALRQQIDNATPDELAELSLAHLGVDDADADDLRDFVREIAYARGEPCGLRSATFQGLADAMAAQW